MVYEIIRPVVVCWETTKECEAEAGRFPRPMFNHIAPVEQAGMLLCYGEWMLA
jgi:hypothetical protein